MEQYNLAYVDRESSKTERTVPFYNGPNASTIIVHDVFRRGSHGVYTTDGERIESAETIIDKMKGKEQQIARLHFLRARQASYAINKGLNRNPVTKEYLASNF